MDKQISIVVLSYNEKEKQYVFNQTLRVLKDGIIKVDYSKKDRNYAELYYSICNRIRVL